MKELKNEINQNNLIYYFKGNIFRKMFDDFNNGIGLFKMKSGAMKLEEAKQFENLFKSNINKISRGRYQSKKQKRALEKFNLLYEWRESLGYLMIIFQLYLRLNTKQFTGKWIPSMSASIAKVSHRKVCHHSNLKILSPKQILQIEIEFLRSETMKLLRANKKTTKDKTSVNVPNLWITEVIWVHIS